MKDPGFAIDLTLRGNIRDYVEVYLGHTNWRDVAGTTLQLDGDLQIARAFPVWLRFETVNGLNAPAPHLSAGPAPVQTDHSDRLPSDPSGMRARSPGGPLSCHDQEALRRLKKRLSWRARAPVSLRMRLLSVVQSPCLKLPFRAPRGPPDPFAHRASDSEPGLSQPLAGRVNLPLS